MRIRKFFAALFEISYQDISSSPQRLWLSKIHQNQLCRRRLPSRSVECVAMSVGVVGLVSAMATVRVGVWLRRWLGVVGMRVWDVLGVLGLVLGVIGIGMLHGLRVGGDWGNGCRHGFSKDAAANRSEGHIRCIIRNI